MNRTEAQNILNATLSLNDGIGRIDDIITSMPEGSEKKVWIQKLGGLIGYITSELQMPIVQDYPDLNPYPMP
jgi:hypothetical protein